jgi:RNA polymerase sigma-70 factor (ECF subfamily)
MKPPGPRDVDPAVQALAVTTAPAALADGADDRARGAPRAAADAALHRADRAMSRCADGDHQAFEELYEVLAPRLGAYLLRNLRSAAWAEDLLQETFIRMHCARAGFRRGAPVLPWAFAIARGVLIDAIRRDRRRPGDGAADEAGEELATSAEPETLAARRQLRERLAREIARLPEKLREAFSLIKLDELSESDAAAVLGTTRATVKLRVFRAKRKLRLALGAELANEEGV